MISPEDDFITPRPMGFGLNENEANCYFYHDDASKFRC
jgi:hypothetical protein